jgi:hypothetical protein
LIDDCHVLRFLGEKGENGISEQKRWNCALEQARLACVQERWEQIMKLGKGTEEKPGDWKALAWSLERTEASSFARPEVQLNLIQQNNVTENRLSITISAQELKEVEAQASPEREKVRQMFAAYRPGALRGGNTERDRDAAISKTVREKFANYRTGGR